MLYQSDKKRIEERNPLKQGLKQFVAGYHGEDIEIEERNPLKQGLKQNIEGSIAPVNKN